MSQSVQAEVARLRSLAGESIAGYKIGCIGPKIREQFGLSGPIRGLLFKSELHPSGSTVSSSMHSSLAVEGEMAVRIGEEGQVAYAFPVIELHNYVLRARIKLLSELVANNALNAGVILPKGEHIMAHPACAKTGTLEVRINDRLADAGALWSMPGGLEEAVAWLTNHLRDYGISLQVGDIILTGTALGLHHVKPGDYIQVFCEGFGGLRQTWPTNFVNILHCNSHAANTRFAAALAGLNSDDFRVIHGRRIVHHPSSAPSQ
jgi:2-keto-4-pentenoate hydratase